MKYESRETYQNFEKKSCGKCEFFFTPDYLVVRQAFCRRFPPNSTGDWRLLPHPSMSWCGEFKRREDIL